MAKRTEITIEQHEITVVRSGQFRAWPASPQRGWCSACEQEALWFTAESAAFQMGLSRREIYRRIEKGELHCNEMADGSVQVCQISLQKSGFSNQAEESELEKE